MSKIFIGREKEIEVLNDAFNSNEGELVAVIGRRRVGKTFLIKTIYEEHICFEMTGLQYGDYEEQLEEFVFQLNLAANPDTPYERPESWLKAFHMLILWLNKTKTDQRRVLFFDELPWLGTPRSRFLIGFGMFWNTWAAWNNVVVVICGSAASWMIEKVINDRGGLHNRVTKRIFLKPFTLPETEAYLKSKRLNLERYHIVQIYMSMGGIPHYLKEIKTGWTATQAIDNICFSETGLLKSEFSKLYQALFEHPEAHEAVVRALASSHQGITRSEVAKRSGLSPNGQLTKTLTELEQSSFIKSYHPFGKRKKEKLFRLTDEYSLFYLRFIENQIHEEEEVWQRLSQTQTYKIWTGYAYENIWLKHIPQIKKALGISGMYSQSSSFYLKPTDEEKGLQIDLLLDRNDHAINLFEIKFYNDEYVMNEADTKSLRERRGIFQRSTKTKKQIFWSLITTFGLKLNKHGLGAFQHVLTLDDLFLP